MQETLTIEIARARTVADLDAVCQEASHRAYVGAVIDLVGRGEISSAYGAKLLGMNKVDFVERMQQQGVPLADESAEILRQEVDTATKDFTGSIYE